ncbi:Uncharacterised protein [Arcanobacterium haemolyticum]|nr:Uncharacterised protein [Arcanobacterium haemolyticum]
MNTQAITMEHLQMATDSYGTVLAYGGLRPCFGLPAPGQRQDRKRRSRVQARRAAHPRFRA